MNTGPSSTMKTTRSTQRSHPRRSSNGGTIRRQEFEVDYDTDDENRRYYSDYGEDDDDDNSSIGEISHFVKSSSSCPPQPIISTTEVVEESNFQVEFCETTIEEMNQIMEWWSSKAWMEDSNQSSFAPNNSLLRLQEEEEEAEQQTQVQVVSADEHTQELLGNSLLWEAEPADQLSADVAELVNEANEKGEKATAATGSQTAEKGENETASMGSQTTDVGTAQPDSLRLDVDQPLPTVALDSNMGDSTAAYQLPSQPMGNMTDFLVNSAGIPEGLTLNQSPAQALPTDNDATESLPDQPFAQPEPCSAPEHSMNQLVTNIAQEFTDILVDQLLAQDGARHSPLQTADLHDFAGTLEDDLSITSSGSDQEMPDFSLRSCSSPREIHDSVRLQDEEVTRLLFQTRDMADLVAALTESSATEEDEEEATDTTILDNSTICSEVREIKAVVAPPPPKLPPPRRRSNMRRRRRSNKIVDNPTKTEFKTLKPSKLEDSAPLDVRLEWQDLIRLWLLRQGTKLEMLVVSRVLIPLLPPSLLSVMMNRPETFRKQLRAVLIALLVTVPALLWMLFPTRMAITEAPLPSLDLFLMQPFFDHHLLYCLRATSADNSIIRSLVVEGDLDFGLI